MEVHPLLGARGPERQQGCECGAVAVLAAPQHQLADRIGEQAVGDSEPTVDRRLRAIGIGREKHLERGAMGDLGEERSRRAEDEHGFVSGLLLEQLGDLFRRFCEVGGDSNVSLGRPGGRGEKGAKRRDKRCQPQG